MDKLNRDQLTILPLSERRHKMTVADVYALDAEFPPYENPTLPVVADRIAKAHRAGQTGHLDDGRARHATRQLPLHY